MRAADLLTLLGPMPRERLERLIAMMAATAPDDFEMALRGLDRVDPDRAGSRPDPTHDRLDPTPDSGSDPIRLGRVPGSDVPHRRGCVLFPDHRGECRPVRS